MDQKKKKRPKIIVRKEGSKRSICCFSVIMSID